MVKLVLVARVYKPSKLENVGPLFYYQGPRMVAQEGPRMAAPFEVPGDKIQDQNFQVYGVYRPLGPKQALPHPITIQNMRFDR